MSLFDLNNSFRIRDIQHLHLDKTSVFVSSRPYHALAFRVKGTAFFENEENLNITAPQNSITYMPANISYHADYSENNEIYVIHFDADKKRNIEIYELFSPQIVLNYFIESYNTWKKSDLSFYYNTMTIFYEILANIYTQIDVFHKSESAKSFYEAIEYMKKNYTDYNLTIDELTKIAKMSNTYFRKMFYNKFGENPSKYITHLRLKHAENLLSKGNISINDAALLSGFMDSKYFSRVVKKTYGYAPSKIYIHNETKFVNLKKHNFEN